MIQHAFSIGNIRVLILIVFLVNMHILAWDLISEGIFCFYFKSLYPKLITKKQNLSSCF